MPQGKHKGSRVLLTLDKDAYAHWKDCAEKLDMPTATLLRQVLEAAREPMGEVADAAEAMRSGEIDTDALLARLMLGLVKDIRDLK